MDPEQQPFRPPPVHKATARLRKVLVLNEAMEYRMRQHLHINETDFQAMQHLMRARSMSPGELAKAVHLTSAATTTVVDRLVAAGHARRVRHATDRRRWLVQPTESSIRETMGQLMPMIMETDAVVASMDDAGQRAVVTYIDAVVEAMERRLAAMAAASEATQTAAEFPETGAGPWT